MKIHDTILVDKVKKIFRLWEEVLKEYTHRNKIFVHIPRLKHHEGKAFAIIIDDNAMVDVNLMNKSISFWYKKVRILYARLEKNGKVDLANSDMNEWEYLQSRLPDMLTINDNWSRKIDSENKESIMLGILNKLIDNIYKDVIDPFEQQLAEEKLTADKMLEEFYKEYTKE